MAITSTHYTKTAVVLHWLIGLGIIFMLALGWYMCDLPKEAAKTATFDLFDLGVYQLQLAEAVSPRTFYFNLHKSIGVTVLALIVLRILWRITHKPPVMLESHKPWEKKLAHATHHTLYLLMIAMPLSGLIMAAYSKYGVKWFGIQVIAGLNDNTKREIFVEIHEFLALVFAIVIVLHVLGALKHLVIDKDGTLKRMSLLK
ncbi:MAG: cytochrome b [Methylophilaceae bacterium]|jgi:cytochrome b561|nr:cytochrome b [Methyloradius sp.]